MRSTLINVAKQLLQIIKHDLSWHFYKWTPIWINFINFIDCKVVKPEKVFFVFFFCKWSNCCSNPFPANTSALSNVFRAQKQKRLGELLYSAPSSKFSNDETHACTLTRHYTARGTWPSMWNHYAGFLPPAECRWDVGPTYYSPDVPVIHHCLPCPHRALEDVWSTAPKCVCVCVCVYVWLR